MGVQILYTERLALIPFTLRAARFLSEGNISVLHEFGIQPTPYWPDQEAIDTFPKVIKSLERVQVPTGYESWMIVLKRNSTVIGDAGFKCQPNADGEVDIGYSIIVQEHQNGYGTEAARALAAWAFRQPEVKQVTAKCLISNTASARVLAKLGMQEVNRDEEMIYWSVAKQRNFVASPS
jgi:ribosomal-protein-alanine N-acetyltransferase